MCLKKLINIKGVVYNVQVSDVSASASATGVGQLDSEGDTCAGHSVPAGQPGKLDS